MGQSSSVKAEASEKEGHMQTHPSGLVGERSGGRERAESREQRAESREQRAESREQSSNSIKFLEMHTLEELHVD